MRWPFSAIDVGASPSGATIKEEEEEEILLLLLFFWFRENKNLFLVFRILLRAQLRWHRGGDGFKIRKQTHAPDPHPD